MTYNYIYEVKQLHAVLLRVRIERDTMQRNMGRYRISCTSQFHITPTWILLLYPHQSLLTPNSVGDEVQEKLPLSCQRSVDQLRQELSQKDLAMHSKMDQMVQICQDYYDVSIMRIRWHSDYRLGHMY